MAGAGLGTGMARGRRGRRSLWGLVRSEKGSAGIQRKTYSVSCIAVSTATVLVPMLYPEGCSRMLLRHGLVCAQRERPRGRTECV